MLGLIMVIGLVMVLDVDFSSPLWGVDNLDDDEPTDEVQETIAHRAWRRRRFARSLSDD